MGSFDLIGRPRESLFPTRGSQAHEEHKRSGGTVNRHIACLSAALSFAMQERQPIDRGPVSNIGRKKESRGRTRFLSDEERAALLDACENSAWNAAANAGLARHYSRRSQRESHLKDDRGQGALRD